MLNIKNTWIGKAGLVFILVSVFFINPVSSQPKVDFHGAFNLAPQYLPAGESLIIPEHLSSIGLPGSEIENGSVLMLPYRARLRTEITFQDWQTLKATIGFVAANGPFNILPFGPDNLNQFRPTWDIINTVSSDRTTSGGTNVPNVTLEKANIYWKPIPGSTSLEFVAGLYDVFDHFPLDQYFTGAVGITNNNAVAYEDRAFIGTTGYTGDSFTPTLITVTPSVWGVAGRVTSKLYSLEVGWHTSDINDIFNTGGPLDGIGWNLAPEVGAFRDLDNDGIEETFVGEHTDYNAAYFQAGYYSHFMGLKGGWRAGYGQVWNNVLSEDPASAWFINIDHEITPNTGIGGIMAYFIYDKAEANPINYSLTGNKEKIGAGITYSPNGFGFIAEDYLGFGWAKITSHEGTEDDGWSFPIDADGTRLLPARFAPRIGSDLPEENRFEFFWRHQLSPGLDIIPGVCLIKNAAGAEDDADNSTITIYQARLVYLF